MTFKKIIRKPQTAWIVLAGSLLFTLAAWKTADVQVERRLNEELDAQADSLANAISIRVEDAKTFARLLSASLESQNEISREDWESAQRVLDVAVNFPAVQSLGYSPVIHASEYEALEERMRLEGFSGFKTKDHSQHDAYSPVLYRDFIDNESGGRAWDADMLANRKLRTAIETARDLGQVSVAYDFLPAANLPEEPRQQFIVFAPLYETEEALDSIPQRRKSFTGTVYGVCEIDSVFGGVLGLAKNGLLFEIFDGDNSGRSTYLFRSGRGEYTDGEFSNLVSKSDYRSIRSVGLNDRQNWTLEVHALPRFANNMGSSQPLIIAIAGVTIDILLFLVIAFLSRSARNAAKSSARSSRKLENAQKRLELALDSAKMGVWERDLASGEIFWDHRMHAVFGVEEGSHESDTVISHRKIHPEDREKVVQNDALTIESGEPVSQIFRILMDDGSIRYIKSTTIAIRDAEGVAYRLIGLNYDVTEQYESERRLRVSNMAIEAATYGVVITDATEEHLIQYVNPAFEEITGYSKSEVIGKNCRFLSARKQNAPGISQLKEALSCLKPVTVTLRNMRKDGSMFWNRLSIAPVFNEQNELQNWIGIQEDITTEKNQAEQLNAAMAQAQEMAYDAEAASRAKSAFLATMSHEIRTPMNAVIGMSTLLANTTLSEEQKEYVETVQSSGSALLSLIDDILDFSKIEAGEVDLEHVPFDPLGVIYESVNMVASKANLSGVELGYTIDSELPEILIGDPNRIRQVLVNLLSNAVKFTHAGSVILETHIDLVENHADGITQTYDLIISVIDTGIGISEEAIEKLFDPFTQADTSTTRKYGGTGLGLAISRRLAEVMGGGLSVESEPGRGSKFTFAVPLSGETVSLNAFSNYDTASLKGKHYAFKDCRPENRTLLGVALSAWGMTEVEPDDARLDLVYQEIPNTTVIQDDELLKVSNQDRTPRVLLFPDFQKIPKAIEGQSIVFKPARMSALNRVTREVLEIVETHVASSLVERNDFYDEDIASGKLRILIAEDNKVNQRVLTHMLKRLGQVADVVDNGQEAVEQAYRQHYDIIFMDVQMPILSGLEATARIRNDIESLSRETHITALTANATSQDSQECLDAGMDNFMSKPIDLGKLKENLVTAFDKRTKVP